MPRGKHGNHARASAQHRWKAGSRPGTLRLMTRADHNRLHHKRHMEWNEYPKQEVPV